MPKAAVLCLLALFAPLTQGIGFKPDIKLELRQELKPELKPDLQPELKSELQPERTGPQSASAPSRAAAQTGTLTDQALQFFGRIKDASSQTPLLLMNLKSGDVASVGGDFMPSEEFVKSGAEQSLDQGQVQRLPWGIHNPATGADYTVHERSGMPTLNFPTSGIEWSLENGGNIQTFSKTGSMIDVKIITQVLLNITNGFYVDSNGGDGEQPSNTLLLEVAGGWRGLVLEQNVYKYAALWSKMRKAWLFLGCMSPHENATKVGWNVDYSIDDNSGWQIHAYNMPTFLQEMGGLNVVDFWNLESGCYEAEILNETLLHSGSHIEFGVVLVTLCGRTDDLGSSPWVQPRSLSDTETLTFQIFDDAGFNYLGGLDATFNDAVPGQASWQYNSHLFANPTYFANRNLPVPSSVKAAAPRQTEVSHQGAQFTSIVESWDVGLDADEEVAAFSDYIRRSKADAAPTEQIPFAHRLGQGDVQQAKYNPTMPPGPNYVPNIRQQED